MPPLRRLRLLLFGLVLAPLPAAAAPRPATDIERLLEARLVSGAESLGVELRCEDPLREAARELAIVRAAGQEVEAHEFLRQAYSQRGVLDPFPYVVYGSVLRGGEMAIAAQLLDHLAELSARERRLTTHVAAGVVERSRRRFFGRERTLFVTLVLVQRALSFAPYPHPLHPGDRFLFEGEVHPPFRRPEILLTRPDGDVVTLHDLSLEPGSFRVWVRLDAGAGEYQLEVVGRDDMGPRVLGLCSLHARSTSAPTAHERIVTAARDGTLEPHTFTAPVVRTNSPAAAEARMFEVLNRDRERAGLPPLVLDPQLGAMARAHSLDMFQHDFFAHVSPNTGRLADRAQAAGVHYARLAENIAVHGDVEAAEAALLRSPGHRVNILDAEFTHVGIGVALGDDSGGARRLFVTQNFMVPAGSPTSGAR